jgi:three-Cys-motif partner protein
MAGKKTDFRPDSVGYWTEVKLDIVKKYAAAYATILSRQPEIKRFIYIDGFAGGGKVWSEDAQVEIPGSVENALAIKPPFTEYHLIDLDKNKAAQLKILQERNTSVHVYEGDCNDVLLTKVLPRCQYNDYARGLCLLDPYGLHVDWDVLEAAGKLGTVEIFYNFMIMDANRNVLWRNPDNVSESQRKRMDKVWGDRTWKDAAYVEQPTLFGSQPEKVDNEVLAEAFRLRLVGKAGFKYVLKPMPMRNSNGAVVYYLYFASGNSTGGKIVGDIFEKYRKMGVQ